MVIIKPFLRYPSGSGVYIVQLSDEKTRVVIIYKNGFFTDWPVDYGNGQIACDDYHSLTTLKYVKRAFKYLNKNLIQGK